MPKADQIETSRMEQQPALRDTNPNQLGEDIIDLYKLWLTLWKRKWLVIIITVLSALGSKLYSMQLPHIYRAEALILAPKEKDLTLLNLHQSLLDTEINETAKIITKINSDKIFSKFKNNLKSRRMIKRFIQQYGLMEDLAPNRTAATRNEDIYQGFANLITLKKENGITSLSIELKDKEKAAIWINDFIGFVDKQTISFLVENVQNSIENRIVVIENNIKSKRLMAEKRREDQIVRYSEHAQIAKQIGMIGRVDATNIIQNTQMNVDIATTSTPLYYLGYEALMTQIEILRTRESDDPFITGLRDLQEQLAVLRTIKFDKEKLSAVNIDQAAYPPNSPISPNERFILTLVTIIGFLSAILLSFLVEYISRLRKIYSS